MQSKGSWTVRCVSETHATTPKVADSSACLARHVWPSLSFGESLLKNKRGQGWNPRVESAGLGQSQRPISDLAILNQGVPGPRLNNTSGLVGMCQNRESRPQSCFGSFSRKAASLFRRLPPNGSKGPIRGSGPPPLFPRLPKRSPKWYGPPAANTENTRHRLPKSFA